MSKRRVNVDQRLDELYREHPQGFVAGRDRLSRDLREAGDREEADRVGGLRRPTVAGWMVNRAALSAPAEAAELAEAGEELERAQRRALEGGTGATETLRDAAAREREAAGAVAETADRAAREAGHSPSKRTLELVIDTLRAASSDGALRERIVRGRVEREQAAATLGMPLAGTAAGGRASPPRPRREIERARRELRRLEGELAEASTREQRLRAEVADAEEALRDGRDRLAESERATGELRRKVEAARDRAEEGEAAGS